MSSFFFVYFLLRETLNSSNFQYSEYFGDEGAVSPFSLVKMILNRRTHADKKELTVENLIESIRKGYLV